MKNLSLKMDDIVFNETEKITAEKVAGNVEEGSNDDEAKAEKGE